MQPVRTSRTLKWDQPPVFACSGMFPVMLFRLEAFNSTNTPQWSKPGATLGTSTFGIVTSAGANRVVQAALKYSF